MSGGDERSRQPDRSEQGTGGKPETKQSSTFALSLWILTIALLVYLFPAYQGASSNTVLRVAAYVFAAAFLLIAILVLIVALWQAPHVRLFIRELFGGLFRFSGLRPTSTVSRDQTQSLFGAAIFMVLAVGVHTVLIWLIGLPGVLEAFVEILLLCFVSTFVAGTFINAFDESVIKPFMALLQDHSDSQTTGDLARRVKRTTAAAVFGLSAIIGLVVGLVELIRLFR